MSHRAHRYHDISAGHRVVGHENKCRFLHGHNYRIHFTCVAELDSVGRVIDFGVMKSTLCQWLEDNWDHKMLLWTEDPIADLGADVYAIMPEFEESVVQVPFNPTAENMAEYLVMIVAPMILPPGVVLESVTVEETRKCSASYSLRDA